MYRTTCKYVICSIFSFLICTFLLLFPAQGQGTAWYAKKLSEATQAKLIQSFFKDGLYDATQKSSSTYLLHFPQGQYREQILFIRARSLELRQRLPQTTLLLYQRLLKDYPQTKWETEASLSIGVLHLQQKNILMHKSNFLLFYKKMQRENIMTMLFIGSQSLVSYSLPLLMKLLSVH